MSSKAAYHTWSPHEEEKLLYLWRKHLPALERDNVGIGNKIAEDLKSEGIEITVRCIECKLRTFKRRYWNIGNDRCKQKNWTHFKRVHEIIKYISKTKDIRNGTHMAKTENGNYSTPQPDKDKRTRGKVNNKRHSSLSVLAKNTHSKNSKRFNSRDNHLRSLSLSSVSLMKKNIPDITNRRRSSVRDTELPKRPRKIWSLEDQEIFLDVWKKYLQDLRAETVNPEVYINMEKDLHSQGIEVSYNEIKNKMASNIRKFRTLKKKSKDPEKKWAHYAKVSEIMGHLKTTELPENSQSGEDPDDSDSWLNDLLDPIICIGSDDDPVIKQQADESDTNIVSEPLNHTHTGVMSAEEIPPVVPEPDVYEVEILNDSIEETRVGKNSTHSSAKSQLTREFGQFVTKELNMLSDDLLIEAKRQIYNIICAMQIKQLQTNRTNH